MKRSLRILHTEAARGMGGQEIYIFRHMQVMRARGHQVSLLCQPDARLAQLARDDGFTVHTLRMGGLDGCCAASGRCPAWYAASATTWSTPPAAATH